MSYVTGKRKSSKKLDLPDQSGTYYVIKNCDVRTAVLVANLNAKGKKHLFFDQQPSEQNSAVKQSDKLQQLYIYESHFCKANFLIRDWYCRRSWSLKSWATP